VSTFDSLTFIQRENLLAEVRRLYLLDARMPVESGKPSAAERYLWALESLDNAMLYLAGHAGVFEYSYDPLDPYVIAAKQEVALEELHRDLLIKLAQEDEC